MKIFANEEELAAKVVEYVRDLKWEVYQEVDLKPLGGVADIIATCGNLLWVLECKLSFSLHLLHQAERHLPFANYISVCTPRRNNCRSDSKILKFLGLGHLTVNEYGCVHEVCETPLHRRINKKWYFSKLCDEQKTWAKAGSANGGQFTPFKMTVMNFKNYITKYPGCSMKEVISNIDHHYSGLSTARTSIYTWLREGVITGVYFEKGKLFLGEKNDK